VFIAGGAGPSFFAKILIMSPGSAAYMNQASNFDHGKHRYQYRWHNKDIGNMGKFSDLPENRKTSVRANITRSDNVKKQICQTYT
jgi:hypothetical protein